MTSFMKYFIFYYIFIFIFYKLFIFFNSEDVEESVEFLFLLDIRTYL